MTTNALGKKLRQRAQQSHSRFCVVLCGEAQWGKETARAMCATYHPDSVMHATDGNLFAEHKAATIVSLGQARQLLGQEFDAVMYDCFSGFDADTVGILGGTIRAGGLLILIAPAVGQWSEFDDPQYARITAYGNSNPKYSRYIKRLIHIISQSPHCILIRQHHPLPQLVPEHQSSLTNPQDYCARQYQADFTDQNNAIAAIKRVISGQRRRPVVLLSDRGRGKSAALGIAAGQLLNSGLKRIAVTGLNRQSTACVFKYAVLNTPQIEATQLARCLRFIAADKLIATKEDIDLLLVDEAASIAVSMLQKLLEIYPRIAFASTVHGYEGTGRGFVLRFQALLDAHSRGWKCCTLTHPIRWAQDDALEQFLFDALLLNAEPDTSSITGVADKMVFATLDFNVIDRTDLSENEKLTRDVFGLLTQAHYRTRPADLRHLLDAENLNLFTVTRGTTILGVAVVATDGGFDDKMARKIWANQTRPQGHFLAELLCAQQGLIEAARLHTARIMRIVVNPGLHRHGIGRQLLQHIADFYRGKVDLLGSTFGASPAVLDFWLDSDYVPVRIGHSQSHNTGSHSCTLIKAVSQPGQALVDQAARKFSDNLHYQLNAVADTIDQSLVPAIYRALGKNNVATCLSDTDLVDLVGFACASQNMENIPACLIRLSEQVLKSGIFSNDDSHSMLLVERVLLGKSWKSCLALPTPKGKKQGIARLRHSVAASLVALYPQQMTTIIKKFDLTATVNCNRC